VYNETRFRMLTQADEARAEMLLKEAEQDAQRQWAFYKKLAE